LTDQIGLNLPRNEEIKSLEYTPVDKFKTAKNMIEDSFNDCFLMTTKNKEIVEVLRESTILRKLDKGETLEYNHENPLKYVVMIRMGTLSVTIDSTEGSKVLELEDGDVASEFYLNPSQLKDQISLRIKATSTSTIYMFSTEIFNKFLFKKAALKLEYLTRFLNKCQIFKGLDSEELVILCNKIQLKFYASGDSIFDMVS
jgi:signal-transduction protein with cAMP-binding, CBS, and nucleotidyltransferase domain